ncbi:hypothetical protein OS493_007544 [Desmophyllum pertusum]|uniref:Uncharacterized protein n=1 Tax=Desmophyllum pertusum TaxID=174260 RepID=A0A9W9Z611_9CNID|nr:hypothetical protein OS493_007544 [Desmophyllum pertusum]
MNMTLADKIRQQPCPYACNHLWDGFGRWTNDTWRPYLDATELYNWSLPASKYRRSGTLCVYGDSLGLRLFGSLNSRDLCKKLFLNCTNSYNWIYPLTDDSSILNDDLDFMPEKILEDIRSVLGRPDMQLQDSVLLLNIGLHYPVSVNFTTYQRLMADVIHILKETEVNSQGKKIPKYKAKVIWKSTTAISKHKGTAPQSTEARFMTTQRVILFSAFAMSAMCQAGFDVIDVYPLTDSYPGGGLDVVHYADKVFDTMETLLEKYKAHNNQRLVTSEGKERFRRCTG